MVILILTQGATECVLLFPYYQRGTAWDLIVSASTNKLNHPWPFPETMALKLFEDVCQGVLALHSAGYMHRDVKPLVGVKMTIRRTMNHKLTAHGVYSA